MALVFKIKFQDTLRRWLVSEDFNATTFSLTFSQLEDKIRDLFHLSHTTSLILTYVDKDNDVVTLGDDQDVVDACLVQQLNPLRLDVHEKVSIQQPTTESSMSFTEDANMEPVLKTFLPYTTAADNKNLVRTSTQVLDLKHCTGLLSENSKHPAGSVSNDGLRSVLSQAPVLPNHRTHNAHHVFHRGVQCDGCGMNPIEGPRYKSEKVPNYDLCFSCFDLMGTNTDFKKLDHPETSPQRSYGKFSFFERGSKPVVAPNLRPSYVPECPFSGQAMDFFSSNEYHKKLDARFLEDVTIFDGSELEPGTNFTKTWRMQNNGTLPWPQGTQLAYIGGTALSSMEVVNVKLPEGGLPCGQDVEISVNLAAPNVVGRYVSHWRLALPSGPWFGHTVWVVIQVRSQLGNVIKEVKHCQKTGEASPEKETFPSPGSLKGIAEGTVVLSEEEKKSLQLDTEKDIELDGFSLVEKPVESNQVVSVEKESPEMNLDAQMRLLETIGFDDRESNIFWLKKNNASMQSTLKDLLMSAGWEEKIRNLKEMGFIDEMTNIRLLHKHSGSIKLVVKDLVRTENQAKEKETQQVSGTVA